MIYRQCKTLGIIENVRCITDILINYTGLDIEKIKQLKWQKAGHIARGQGNKMYAKKISNIADLKND